jgi:hypothetical protein
METFIAQYEDGTTLVIRRRFGHEALTIANKLGRPYLLHHMDAEILQLSPVPAHILDPGYRQGGRQDANLPVWGCLPPDCDGTRCAPGCDLAVPSTPPAEGEEGIPGWLPLAEQAKQRAEADGLTQRLIRGGA